MTNDVFASLEETARAEDARDPLRDVRGQFHIPQHSGGSEQIYLCGNSLGLQPKATAAYVNEVLEDWQQYGVEGHFKAKHAWLPYHEYLTGQTARLVGAKPEEVVAMNSLTVNLHLLMVSFYRPTAARHKILIEKKAFPSDRYAVESQLRYHGYDPAEALVLLEPDDGALISDAAIEDAFERHGEEIALVLIGGVQYYSGQLFDMKRIAELGHSHGCTVGFDLAHAAGNVPLHLHDWDVDFAAWCSYKYLNAGPGSTAGIFVHERHAGRTDIPRFAGWWGHDKETRFQMGTEFVPIPTAESWQLSNPPILPLAALRASLDIFDAHGMEALRTKSEKLTGFLLEALDAACSQYCTVFTPREPARRGCQLSIKVHENGKAVFDALIERGVICDWREPDIIRIAPVPLYNTFQDAFNFVRIFHELLRT
ncbi:MAG: kynureninase [Ectothiorhodospiraceae bacterium]|nr:kynureninase [Ectothiorhodospiraceae bacterium]